ncbi:MAG: M24 family metallopeptidase [Lachnospiraceae bacterium]|uniref:M24 family metallopeptidase n=1 Tax=Parablautia sp. Marseille-Q6255 TaxID=3039593 RepID=UPI0024BC6E87|nr:Xaa-Pro peptidase family protein [Parablautia sp. Marseille-Q6255]
MKIQLQKVIKIMKEKGMDLAVLTNPANIRYVSDFDVPFWPAWMGDVSNGLPMVIAIIDVNQEKVHVVASDLYKNKLVRAGLINTALWRSFTHLEKNDVENNYEKVLMVVLDEAAAGKCKPVIGVEPNFTIMRTLATIKKCFPECTLESAEQILAAGRYLKSPEEINGLSEAARVADAAQEKLCEIAQNEGNYTEMDIWFEVQKAASHAAGVLTPFVGELVTGPNTGLSDYPLGPTCRKVKKGDIAIMDISPRVNGYWADCSNSVVFWTKPDEEQLRYFEAVKDAYEAGAEAIYPGRTFREINCIMERQYKKHELTFCSYQGHQIGCSVNELPRFTYVDDSILEEHMVVCIEPQMYTGKAGKTGVRLERMLHVTSNGAVALNKFPWGISLRD